MRDPEPNSEHYKFWLHIRNGGRVWRNDRLNNKQEWIDLEKLGGDANNIKLYGYSDLTIEECEKK